MPLRFDSDGDDSYWTSLEGLRLRLDQSSMTSLSPRSGMLSISLTGGEPLYIAAGKTHRGSCAVLLCYVPRSRVIQPSEILLLRQADRRWIALPVISEAIRNRRLSGSLAVTGRPRNAFFVITSHPRLLFRGINFSERTFVDGAADTHFRTILSTRFPWSRSDPHGVPVEIPPAIPRNVRNVSIRIFLLSPRCQWLSRTAWTCKCSSQQPKSSKSTFPKIREYLSIEDTFQPVLSLVV
jgi:hypothetical protein